MTRFAGILFCLLALVSQVGFGSLPAGDLCLGCTAVPQTRSCRCCGEQPSPSTQCSHTRGCDHCIRVQLPEQLATTVLPTPSPATPELPVALLTRPAIEWSTHPPIRSTWQSPRATESPPGLAPIRTTRLLI